jgi:hypothetical protein
MTELTTQNNNQSLFAFSVHEMKQTYIQLKEFTQSIMEKDVDFGVIPGTGNKSTLLKPGAEKLNLIFGYRTKLECTHKELDISTGYISYTYKCSVLDRNEIIKAEGEGVCSTLEKKYAKTNVYENGIKASVDTTVEEKLDKQNTILKMAQKRAYIAATLNATGTSQWFTQDLEDFATTTNTNVEQANTIKPKNEETIWLLKQQFDALMEFGPSNEIKKYLEAKQTPDGKRFAMKVEYRNQLKAKMEEFKKLEEAADFEAQNN